MSNEHYPYEAPAAEVIGPAEGSGRLFSPMQAAMGALVGGPVGTIYFLWANFRTLQKHTAAIRTLWLGVIGIAAVVASVFLLPDNFPNAPFSIAYVVIAGSVARHYQLSKRAIAASDRFAFHSNWRVLGLGVLSLLGSVAAILAMAAIAVLLGLVDASSVL